MRAPASTALVFALALVALTGCAPGTADDADTGTDDSSQGTDDSGDASDTDSSADDTDDASTGGGSCVDPVLTDGGEVATITISADAMSPSSVDISAGDVVKFVGDGAGYHGLLVGSLASVSVGSSLPEYYRFDSAGACDASDELGSGTATINVG
jgi:plastocyanin